MVTVITEGGLLSGDTWGRPMLAGGSKLWHVCMMKGVAQSHVISQDRAEIRRTKTSMWGMISSVQQTQICANAVQPLCRSAKPLTGPMSSLLRNTYKHFFSMDCAIGVENSKTMKTHWSIIHLTQTGPTIDHLPRSNKRSPHECLRLSTPSVYEAYCKRSPKRLLRGDGRRDSRRLVRGTAQGCKAIDSRQLLVRQHMWWTSSHSYETDF